MKPHQKLECIPISERLPRISMNIIIKEIHLAYVTQFTFDPLSKFDCNFMKTKVEFWIEELPEQQERKSAEEVLGNIANMAGLKDIIKAVGDKAIITPNEALKAMHEFASQQQPKPTDEEK